MHQASDCIHQLLRIDTVAVVELVHTLRTPYNGSAQLKIKNSLQNLMFSLRT